MAGTGLRPLLEALWQQVRKTPESGPFVDEHPYVPPASAKERSDEQKFQYISGEADEEAWEAVDGEEALAPQRDDRFIDAAGDPVVPPKSRTKKADKLKRTLLQPVQARRTAEARRSAKQRKSVHDLKVKQRKQAAAAPETPPPKPQVDAELAAEIAAIKADDVRKGKFYSRRKTDV